MLTVQCSLTKWAKACAMPNQRVSMVTVFQERRIRQDPQLTIPKEMDRSIICIGLWRACLLQGQKSDLLLGTSSS